MKDLYIQVLEEELVPALGCTEPIAIAYAAAKAREVLGQMPESMIVECSGNVIKNVKGVTVPMTPGMKGIETSAILGAVGGEASRKLEVLTLVTDEHIQETKEKLEKKICQVELAEGVEGLYIKVLLRTGQEEASVTLKDCHTGIIEITKNQQVLPQESTIDVNATQNQQVDRSFLSIQGIYDYIRQVDAEKLKPVLEDQVTMNRAIAEDGLANPYGANVGKTLLELYGDAVDNKAKAYAASGSDARMSGCSKPVVINSGSGNQGLTVSLPVIVFAEYLEVPEETLYRALALSNLISIHIKTGIGKLSAFCGAVSASCGATAAIAYLHQASFPVIARSIANTLANTSGIVCDGAKASCAAKIASSVDAAILSFRLAEKDQYFEAGDGLLKEDIEETIRSVCRMAKIGMKETDVEILKIMIES
ncbi:L-cysteine desulfidase family protein [Tindallia californiensis]|uniref:UPF0597 protein SAMN05192546_10688 n=1 Tax=Tindallia californiensis TaxID=159292 RepID=A0A1H3P9W3_9FIRM|nr:L-serine ammonia-lyase, iron-sulfur-dependent, subunit alpha [Tindallia californiensis]SDY97830.1 L-cysteine desulfidase [Tindallia californiensis]